MVSRLRMGHVAAWLVGCSFVLGLMLTLNACAAGNKVLVQTEVTAHDTTAKLDDEVREFCTSHAELKEPCADTKEPMLALVNATIALNRGIRGQKLAAYTDVLTAVGQLGKVLAKLPEGATAKWFEDIKKIVTAAGQGV